MVLILLIGFTLFYFFMLLKTTGIVEENRLIISQALGFLFLLMSLLLIPGIYGQFVQANRENDIRPEEPGTDDAESLTSERRIFWNGGQETLIPIFVEFLEQHFTRYFTFHRFHSPPLLYYYLAKKGSLSLYALPWVKSGFLICFLACFFIFTEFIMISVVTGLILLVVVAVFFWIPCIFILIFAPFQKFWLSWVEQGGSVQVTITGSSPFREGKAKALCVSLESMLQERMG